LDRESWNSALEQRYIFSHT
jgi:hypothetical protein